MSSFDIETVWKRFLITLIGGLVAAGVFYLIIHSAQPAASTANTSSDTPTRVTQLAYPAIIETPDAQNVSRSPTNRKALPKPLPSGLPTTARTPSAEEESRNSPSPVAPKTSVRIVVVNSRSSDQLLDSDGAFFPKGDSWVRVREVVADSSVRLTGLPAGENDFYYSPVDDTKHFTAGRLEVTRNFRITVRNGRLTASGELAKPMFLTFQSQSSQPGILLWPAGCQAVFDADCDAAGNISLHGGEKVLDGFANIINDNSNPAVRLFLSLPASDFTTNLPVAGLQYGFWGVAAAKAQATQKDELLQGQLAVVAAFQKFFQASGSASGSLPFWQALDQKCQLITQGRLGLINYDFSGDAVSRNATRQMVLEDVSSAPSLAADLKKVAQATFTEDNLAVMAALDDRIAWKKNLAMIASQLNAGRQKLHPSATPSVVAEFRYAAVNNQVAGSEMLLGRLAFNAALSALPVNASSNSQIQQMNQVNAQIQRLDFKILELKSKYNPSTAPSSMKAKYVSELSQLESQKRNLQAQLIQFR